MNNDMKIYFAPVQGHTDAPYRYYHHQVYGNDIAYCTPFIRLERDELRPRDIKDFTSELNQDSDTEPQIIFRDREELERLVALMRNHDVARINLNMGCPFPLQTGHGRGAATVAREDVACAVEDVVRKNPGIEFSLKMRLGMNDPEEWKSLLPHLNNIPLRYLAVHPRVARQQYGGDLYLDQFADIVEKSGNPVVFNGELRAPQDIDDVVNRFSDLQGVMIGRGMLGRPSIAAEYLAGEEWPREKRLETMLRFHRLLLDYYSGVLCGESQIVQKIKPFWEYSEDEIGRKAWKAIKKAVNIAKYHSAVASIK